MDIPLTAQPTELEERAISACFGDPAVLYHLIQRGTTWRDFGNGRTRAIMQAMTRCIDPEVHTEPWPIEVATVLSELRALGYDEGTVPPAYVRQLDKAGVMRIVDSWAQYGAAISAAAVARKLASEAHAFADQVLRTPDQVSTLLAGHVERTTAAAARSALERDHSIQALNAENLDLVPGLYTGIPFLDIVTMGCCESELIGLQARQKGGKTRTALWMLLRPLTMGVPTCILTTDNRAQILRLRLLAMLATAWMIGKPSPQEMEDGILLPDKQRVQPVREETGRSILFRRAPSDEWTLEPRRLAFGRLTPIQRAAVMAARETLNGMKLWVLDTSEGVQDFERAHDHLYRYTRPPYNCRLLMFDHIADLSYRGSSEVSAFQYMVKTLKSSNIDWGTTMLLLNQRNEGANSGKGGSGYGSYMGGSLPASVDHLLEANDKNTDSSRLDLEVLASRWYQNSRHAFIVNATSGLVLNPLSVPDFMRKERDSLPYMQRGQNDLTWTH